MVVARNNRRASMFDVLFLAAAVASFAALAALVHGCERL